MNKEQTRRTQTKNICVVAYVLPIGWLLALAFRLLCDEHTPLSRFHLAQALGLCIVEVVGYVLFVCVLDVWILSQLASLVCLALALYGVSGALKGELRPQPLLGRFFNAAFAPLFDASSNS